MARDSENAYVNQAAGAKRSTGGSVTATSDKAAKQLRALRGVARGMFDCSAGGALDPTGAGFSSAGRRPYRPSRIGTHSVGLWRGTREHPVDFVSLFVVRADLQGVFEFLARYRVFVFLLVRQAQMVMIGRIPGIALNGGLK